MDSFSCKTTILSGRGSLKALADLQIRRLFLVADPFFVRSGKAAELARLSGAEAHFIFDRVEPDPSAALAAEGTAQLQQFAPDTVAALGGGSAIDLAKAMVYFAGGKLRLIAIPTTSGSGSEVTDFAILTHDGVKHPLVDEALLPDYAILDSDLLTELPPSLIADTGFDVLTHAVEAAAASNANPITDALAVEAFSRCFRLLGASFHGDRSVRQELHLASAMAGLAFSRSGLGICHALSHALGGSFHVPHGRLNAVLLPAVIHNTEAGAAYAALARQAGLGSSSDTLSVRNLRNALIRLRRELKLPQSLAQAGIDPAPLWRSSENIIRAALADPCCKTSPVPPTKALLHKILEEAAHD